MARNDFDEGSNGGSRSRPARLLEQHLQTVLISLITAAVLFTASYLYNDNRQKAVQQTQLELLTTQVIEMRADLRLLQTNYVKREEHKELDARVRDIERRYGK